MTNTNYHQKNTISKNVKITIWIIMSLFFLFYQEYKPYSSQIHMINSLGMYIFALYQFVINQTLGIVHEGGHGICYILPCPKFFTALNGTLFQWLFPLGISIYYKKKGNIMAYTFALFIFAISLDYTAWYMSTAHQGAFVPASKSFLGVDGYHDFYMIFTTLHILEYDGIISAITKFFSVIIMFFSLFRMFLEAFGSDSKKKLDTHFNSSK